MSNNKQFEWNDYLLHQFINSISDEWEFSTLKQEIDFFKQSKSKEVQELPAFKFIETDSKFLEANASCYDSRWYYMPHWFEKISEGVYKLYSFDKLPEGLKKSLLELRGESVLNSKEEDTVVGNNFYKKFDYTLEQLKEHNKYLLAEFDANVDKVFTQQEVDTIREDAFSGGYFKGWYNGCFEKDKKMSNEVTDKAYKDYLKSLPVNNPQPTQADNKEQQEASKEWKILKLEIEGVEYVRLFDDTGFITRNDLGIFKEVWLLKQLNLTIKSVRRLSDNEVFSIGDKIGWGTDSSYESTLTGFEIKDGDLKFYDEKLPEGRKPCSFLGALNLHKKPQNPIPQAVSTDNTDVACLSLNDFKEAMEEVKTNGVFSKEHFFQVIEQKVNQKLK